MHSPPGDLVDARAAVEHSHRKDRRYGYWTDHCLHRPRYLWPAENDLDGWARTPIRTCAAHLVWILDGKMGSQRTGRDNNAYQDGLDHAQRRPYQRSYDDDRKVHPSRRSYRGRHHGERPRLRKRAIHSYSGFETQRYGRT